MQGNSFINETQVNSETIMEPNWIIDTENIDVYDIPCEVDTNIRY